MKLPINYDYADRQTRRIARNQYISEQNGKCWYCKNDLSGEPADHVLRKSLNRIMFPKGFLNYPVHLHHDHNTGLTIGAVHAKCNGVLWQYHGE